MKFIIGVDLEGAACVVGSPGKTLTESPDYQFACRQATKEADAAARALFDSGARQVIVWDNHGGGQNLIYEDLDERCDIALGTGTRQRWPGLDGSFDGALLIGYHPMDNTIPGVLAHTFSSVSYQWMKVNGLEVGEMAVDAAVAGEHGVPVIFVASDDQGVLEAKRFMPWIETAATKKALARNMAISSHPAKAVRDIYKGVKNSILRLGEMNTFGFDTPLTVQLRYKRPEGAQEAAVKGWKLIDPYTVEQSYDKLSSYFSVKLANGF